MSSSSSTVISKSFQWGKTRYSISDQFNLVKKKEPFHKGTQSPIYLVFRINVSEKEELLSALQRGNSKILDGMMRNIKNRVAVFRKIRIGYDLKAHRMAQKELECLQRLPINDPYFPTIMNAKIYSTKKKPNHLLFGVVMNYYPSGDLFEKIISSQGSRSLLQYGLSAIQAVEHLQALDIIHRDLKPENFLIASETSVVLIDFGFACHETSKTTDICGSLDYVAPEIYQGLCFKASDVFSLGVSLFHILRFVDASLIEVPFFKQIFKYLGGVSGPQVSLAEYMNRSSALPFLKPRRNPDNGPCLIYDMLQKDYLKRPLISEVRERWMQIIGVTSIPTASIQMILDHSPTMAPLIEPPAKLETNPSVVEQGT